MKMVKSLLLGTAAGLVAMTGAQAADLPVKAKPVQYVKICSLYGAGFYYIPGTDMCLKIGGWVRAEYAYGDNGSMTWGPMNGNASNRLTSNSTWRSRGYITADARNQSEYGTIRSYIAIGINTNSIGLDGPASTFSSNRAFIQVAGFTFGLSQSFFDFYSVPATALWGSYPASDTGDPGWQVLAYTAQFGGGLSATISAEQRRTTQIINQNEVGFAAGGRIAPGSFDTSITSGNFWLVGGQGIVGGAGLAPGVGAYGGFQVPDFVGNLRIDQAWGSAQIMGALHQVNSNYYGYGSTGSPTVTSGHPDDKWGFAVGAGLKFFTPAIGAGDYLQAQVNYAEGASRYVFSTPNSNWGIVSGAKEAFGVLSDAVYGGTAGTTATDLNLTTAWGVNAAYEHFWVKNWKTSAYGGYAAVSYNGQAQAMLCNAENNAAAAYGGVGAGSASVIPAGSSCNNNWNTWWVGSRTQWNVSPDTYLAVDVLYSKLNSANGGGVNGLGASATPTGGAIGAGSLAISGSSASNSASNGGAANLDNWAFRFRVHKDFYP